MADSRLTVTVQGVESDDDVRTLTDELEAMEGVQMADVNAASGHTEVRYGEELLSAEAIKTTIRDAGYEVE